MLSVIDDVRSAARYLRRRPLFAVAVTATLAAAIAVASTSYGVARAVLWRALPYDDSQQLVFVWEETSQDGQPRASRVTGARYAAWRDTSGPFSSLALFGAAGFTVETAEGATSVRGVRVSANFFDTLGIRPMLGRSFAPNDERPGSERVVVLANGFWRERLGGRPEAVGETIRLGGQPYRVVGVMPSLTFPAWPVNPATVTLDADSRQVWVPITRTAALDQSAGAHVFGVVGRLSPGVTLEQARDRLLATSTPAAPDPHGARLELIRDQFVRDARTPLVALTAAALAVLLIACANVATLYVSAFEVRRGELAVRAAVGAGVPRLVRQLAVEALLLVAAGAAAGMFLTRAALAFVPDLLPASVPLLTVPAVDGHVTAFAGGLALLACLMFTAWPVGRLITTGPLPRGAIRQSRGPVYRVLVIAQVALTMGLVPAAVLLSRSLASVQREDPGFAIQRVLAVDIGLPASGASAERLVRIEQDLLAAIMQRPGVRAVAAAYDHPLEANWSENPTIVGDARSPDDQRHAELRIVSPGYFEAMQVRRVDGRTLTERDTLDTPGVAVVNEAFARDVGGRVLGRTLRTNTPRFVVGAAAPSEFTIVGIVGNERFRGLERPALPAFYLSTRQFPQGGFSLLVHTSTDPMRVVADLRSTIRSVDDRITFDRAMSLESVLGQQLVSRQVTTHVIAAFAIAALALAALGIYSVLTVFVGSRAHEIGVRLAIGASPSSVRRSVIGDTLRITSLGVLLGFVLTTLAGRLIRHLLVDVSPSDPATLGGVVLAVFTVAAGAALVPAARAARIDPVGMLRGER